MGLMVWAGYLVTVNGVASPFLATSFGLDDAGISFAFGFMSLDALPTLLLTRRADHRGRRSVLLAACSALPVVTLIAAIVPNLSLYVLVQVVRGFLTGTTVSIVVVMLAEVLPAERRARGQARAGIAGAFGGGLALVVVSSLEHVPGTWRWAWALAALPALALPLVWRVLPETDAFAHAAARGEVTSGRMLDLFGPPRRRIALARLGTMFVGGIPGAAAGSWVFYHVVHTLGMPASVGSAIFFAGGTLGIAGFPVAARVADSLGRKATLALAATIAPLASLAFYTGDGATPSVLRLGLSFAALAIAGNASITAGRALGAELFPTRLRSTYYGWAYLAESSSVIAAQFLVSALTVGTGGLAQAILWLQILALPSFAVFWVFVPETLGRDLDDPSPEPPAQ
ncbi:MAG: MFS transporter [Deltaproteobacteria bacterium]|nr:MFS transporter [Deltaproteobacteria bacterium]